MKILITGCRGQLGTELQKQLSDEGCALGPLPERLRKATVIPVDVDELDITDREATINYIRRHQPDTVINCAAFTNVDGCETNRDVAFKVNAIGPRNLALACEKVGARLIHVSTDYVFPGTANGGVPLDECAVPAPISAYGQTKLLGEQYVERFCRRYFIVRTAWLYSNYGKNFVKTMIRLGQTHDKITMSEKSDKLRAMLEKEKERRIKLNNRIEILERRIQEEDSAEVNEMVRTAKVTPEQLAALLRQSATATPTPAALSAVGATFEKEVDADED